MKFSLPIIFLCLGLSHFVSANDELKDIFKQVEKEYPATLLKLRFDKKNEPTIKFSDYQRSDPIPYLNASDLSTKENQYYGNGKTIPLFLASTKKLNNKDYHELRNANPHMIIQFDFEIKEKQKFIMLCDSPYSTEGTLNDKKVSVTKGGYLSLKNSGERWVELSPGKYQLTLVSIIQFSHYLKIYTKKDLEILSEEVSKIQTDITPENKSWFFELCKILADEGYDSYQTIIKVLNAMKNSNQLKINSNYDDLRYINDILNKVPSEGMYAIREHLLQTHGEEYFSFINYKNKLYSLVQRHLYNELDPILFEYYIRMSKWEKAKEYKELFKKYIQNSTTIKNKEELFDSLKVSEFYTYFRTGEIEMADSIFKEVNELFTNKKDMPKHLKGYYGLINHYERDRPNKQSELVLQDPTAATIAFETREWIKHYQNEPDVIEKSFKKFMSLQNLIFMSRDNYVESLKHVFLDEMNKNIKFKKDFLAHANEKIKYKMDKALKDNNIKAIEANLRQFSGIFDSPPAHLVLLKDYFKKGDVKRALFHAKHLYSNLKQHQAEVAPYLIALEDFSNIPDHEKTLIDKTHLNQNIKVRGLDTPLQQMVNYQTNKNSASKPNSLVKAVPLPKYSKQYWNHSYKIYHQGVNSYEEGNRILISGPNFLFALDKKNHEIEEIAHHPYEHFSFDERPPHQKTFAINKAGGQIYFFSNENNSDRKSIKCYNGSNQLLWNTIEQNATIDKEPICAPIYCAGSLVNLAVNRRDTLPTIDLQFLDPQSGKDLSTVPITRISNFIFTTSGQRHHSNWNTYRHDQHFVTEGQFIYGTTNTGLIFKIDAIGQYMHWGRAYQIPSNNDHYNAWRNLSFAPSTYIQLFDDTLVTFTPDTQRIQAFNKHNGQELWNNLSNEVSHIHARSQKDFIYYTKHQRQEDSTIRKVDPKTGSVIWQKILFGMRIEGEGDKTGNELYIPTTLGIVVLDDKDGAVISINQTPQQILKIQTLFDYIVFYSMNHAFFMNYGDQINFKQLHANSSKNYAIVTPQNVKKEPFQFTNFQLEATITIPSNKITSRTPCQLIPTTNPYYHIFHKDDQIGLIREGFTQNNLYYSPQLVWFDEFESYKIDQELLLSSKNGEIRCENLLDRKLHWVFEYEVLNTNKNTYESYSIPLIATNNEKVIFVNQDGSAVVLDKKSGKQLFQFTCGSSKQILTIDNVLVRRHDNGHITAFDLNQQGKPLWSNWDNRSSAIYTSQKQLYFIKETNVREVDFIQLSDGKSIKQIKVSKRQEFDEIKTDKNYLYCSQYLFESNTGNQIKPFEEVYPVIDGGYIAFEKKYSNKGSYFENGNKYDFVYQAGRDYNNFTFTATKRGNIIIMWGFFGLSTYQIKDKELVFLNKLSFAAGTYGNHGHQHGILMQSLTRSFVMFRNEQIHFFSEFDSEGHYQKIISQKVSPTRNQNEWPFSDSFPLVKVGQEQWISNEGNKPSREIQYNALYNSDFSYLHLRVSPKVHKDHQAELFFTCNGLNHEFMVKWLPDEWGAGQPNETKQHVVNSWKEIDNKGYLNLFLQIKSRFLHEEYENSMPDFRIEFHEKAGDQVLGLYRIGGPFAYSRDFLPYRMPINLERSSVSDYELRDLILSKNDNFIPQGDEVIEWLNTRRFLHGAQDNVMILEKHIKNRAKAYCVINLIAALYWEKYLMFQSQNTKLEEFSDEFLAEIKKIKEEIFQKYKNVIQEDWLNYALTFYTVEVFPEQISYEAHRNFYRRALTAINLKGERHSIVTHKVKKVSFSKKNDPAKPHLQFLFAGLFAGYPNEKSGTHLGIHGLNSHKSGIGRIFLHQPNAQVELKKRNQLFHEKFASEVKKYHYSGKTIDVVFPKFGGGYSDHVGVYIATPEITVPRVKTGFGLTNENILSSIKNLPSDSENGYQFIQIYQSLNPDLTLEELQSLQIILLEKIKGNLSYLQDTLRYIVKDVKENPAETLRWMMRKAKIPINTQRIMLMNYVNIYHHKSKASTLGPFDNPPTKLPEDNQENLLVEYSNQKEKMSFTNEGTRKKGQLYYWTTNVIADKDKKTYIHMRGESNYHRNINVNVWLNNEQVIHNSTFSHFEHSLISEKIKLFKGENKILIKLDYQGEISFHEYIEFAIADNCCLPEEGISYVNPIPYVEKKKK